MIYIYPCQKKTEELLLWITNNTVILIDRIEKKPQKTLEIKLNAQKYTFSSNMPIKLEEKLILGLPRLEVYNSVFNITE